MQTIPRPAKEIAGGPHRSRAAARALERNGQVAQANTFVPVVTMTAPHGEPAVSSVRTQTRHGTAATNPARTRPEPLTSG